MSYVVLDNPGRLHRFETWEAAVRDVAKEFRAGRFRTLIGMPLTRQVEADFEAAVKKVIKDEEASALISEAATLVKELSVAEEERRVFLHNAGPFRLEPLVKQRLERLAVVEQLIKELEGR